MGVPKTPQIWRVPLKFLWLSSSGKNKKKSKSSLKSAIERTLIPTNFINKSLIFWKDFFECWTHLVNHLTLSFFHNFRSWVIVQMVMYSGKTNKAFGNPLYINGSSLFDLNERLLNNYFLPLRRWEYPPMDEQISRYPAVTRWSIL